MNDSSEHLLRTTVLWFERARPLDSLTSKMVHTQLGVHFEEISEMLEQLQGEDDETNVMLVKAFDAMKALATHFKKGDDLVDLRDRKLFLDSICDQIVTGTGCAYMMGMDLVGAMRETNRANWSKFDAKGNALYDANGKITKGPNYKVSDLTPFV